MSGIYIVASCLVGVLVWFLYRQYFIVAKNRPYRTVELSIKSRGYLFALGFFLLASWYIPYDTATSTEQGSWIDIMIMLDVSQSMLVQDMPNQLSRLAAAKEIVTILLQKNTQARRGIWIFAGEAQGILPLTRERNLVSTFLAWVDYQNLTKQWTSLGEAIDLWAQRFDSESPGGNMLLVFSDGGEEEVVVSESTKQILEERDIAVYLIGVWSEQGWPIIEWIDLFGNALVKQWQWAHVISKLQEEQLKKTAAQIDASYLRATPSIGDQLHGEIKNIPSKTQAWITVDQQKTFTTFFVLLWAISFFVALSTTFWKKPIRTTIPKDIL